MKRIHETLKSARKEIDKSNKDNLEVFNMKNKKFWVGTRLQWLNAY